MRTMRFCALMILLLLPGMATANGRDLPLLWGNLDWSSDGQYIAVTTTKGLHIHKSGDLSLYKVLTEYNRPAIKWSNHGLRLAVESAEWWGITIWDLESEEPTHLIISNEQGKGFDNFEWAHGDLTIAASGDAGIFVGDIEGQEIGQIVTFRSMYNLGHSWLHWRPPLEVDILSPMMNGIAIYNWYTGVLVDFIWNTHGGNRPARWSPDGNMIAAGHGPVIVWKVLPDHPANAWAEIGGERIHRLTYEPGWIYGLGWHPDSTKLAFIFSHGESGYPPEQDFSRDGALIWNLSTGTTRLIPGVFAIDVLRSDKVIEWSPDGRRLAAVSSDGRIVIWETDSYQVIAEYDGYRSLLDP